MTTSSKDELSLLGLAESAEESKPTTQFLITDFEPKALAPAAGVVVAVRISAMTPALTHSTDIPQDITTSMSLRHGTRFLDTIVQVGEYVVAVLLMHLTGQLESGVVSISTP